MNKKIFRIVFVCTVIVVGYYSTFGWQVSRSSISVRTKENDDMAVSLKRHVYILSSEIGERSFREYGNLEKASRYIVGQFTQLGLEVERQEFEVEGRKVCNIIARKTGTKSPGTIIVVGAHYDSYYTPGADNNASGVAAVLELAAVIAKKEIADSVHFVAFVNGEPPFFQTPQGGSLVYIKSIQEKKGDIRAAIVLDSIGYYSNRLSQRYPVGLGFFCPDKANFIALVGNTGSLKLMGSAETIFKKNISLPAQAVTGFDFVRSDHWAFWKKGYPAILITDTGAYRNPDFYSLSDTYQMLNYRHMAQVVKAASLLAEALGNSGN
ncbi:MAG TPA: M28 family peptidase [Candidatus Omnitrophota bacterium]|nr:M28 family peptidase [Candidatus Omnitrophota bacterium]HPD85065.1 M28 family peptidase [Candidatus Omnitrophota bacterium]HRZ03923.1 M28 family peptidase [Candidatus Omnitrophota bacterium]